MPTQSASIACSGRAVARWLLALVAGGRWLRTQGDGQKQIPFGKASKKSNGNPKGNSKSKKTAEAAATVDSSGGSRFLWWQGWAARGGVCGKRSV